MTANQSPEDIAPLGRLRPPQRPGARHRRRRLGDRNDADCPQTRIVPWAVNVPVRCGGVAVVPGDIIVAAADGAIAVPIPLAETLADVAGEHAEWEEFSRLRLSQGGDLQTSYPPADAARDEDRARRDAQEQTQ